MYKVVIGVNKISFLCLYLRIFITTIFRRICYCGIIIVSAWTLSYLLSTIFQCKPMAYFWDKTIKHPKCANNEALWMSYSIINLILDLSVLALPIYPLSKLKLTRDKRIGLFVVFSMGTFVCITTVIRTSTLVQSASDKDPTSGPIPATIWSVVEANTGIICTCLPVFKHPLQFFFPRLFTSEPGTYLYSDNAPRRTEHASGSERNLTENHDTIWRDDVSNDGVEMQPQEVKKAEAKNAIKKVTDFKISYQYNQASESSKRPIRTMDF
ncbi:uncharacterized protein N7482_008860 [Penicillium canariense]|uniref:Rhodopsin domain-containing protein n=1 Tax=Penicillium canariense TaxID=189055 RepID=A0A9W9HWS5_9EURO|nr:uncharacterized protein N7482_008860 [Penicillium canariense]KAJ5157760.1 hypothetical protein N7482_008860 [Penicillium canariense]